MGYLFAFSSIFTLKWYKNSFIAEDKPDSKDHRIAVDLTSIRHFISNRRRSEALCYLGRACLSCTLNNMASDRMATKWDEESTHDDVIKWKHFPCDWPFVRGFHRSPVNSPHKGQWRGVLMFSLICVWINGWVNNREAGDLRRYLAHYDVSVMSQGIGIVTPEYSGISIRTGDKIRFEQNRLHFADERFKYLVIAITDFNSNLTKKYFTLQFISEHAHMIITIRCWGIYRYSDDHTNLERHTAHAIVSWHNPKQWQWVTLLTWWW